MSGLVKTLVAVSLVCVLGAADGAVAKQASLDVSLAHPTLLAGSSQTTFLKVGLTGFAFSPNETRPPVNVALVLDKSGSMNGRKLEQAKEAAIRALDMLGADDIVSVIAYDSTVRVVLPATKLTDKAEARRAIQGIQAGGNTALFGGVSKGAAEVRKFMDRNHVNRVILLSDGLANVGPSSSEALGQLGASLMKEGVAVTTLGLGLDYNEDLMVALARRSDGNHVFVEEATELATVFGLEFRDVLSVVAQGVMIEIRCAPGIRPIRLLGLEGTIVGQSAVVQLNQLYSEQEKYVLLEVETPASEAGQVRRVADVEVTYANMETKTADRLTSAISVRFDASPDAVEAQTNAKVMSECVLQIANVRNEEAVALRDKGFKDEAKQLLEANCAYLEKNAVELDAPMLMRRAHDNSQQSQSLEGEQWKKARKAMREQQVQDAQLQNPTPKKK